jgi:hypothetical protein
VRQAERGRTLRDAGCVASNGSESVGWLNDEPPDRARRPVWQRFELTVVEVDRWGS